MREWAHRPVVSHGALRSMHIDCRSFLTLSIAAAGHMLTGSLKKDYENVLRAMAAGKG
jgi:hypothetical protein